MTAPQSFVSYWRGNKRSAVFCPGLSSQSQTESQRTGQHVFVGTGQPARLLSETRLGLVQVQLSWSPSAELQLPHHASVRGAQRARVRQKQRKRVCSAHERGQRRTKSPREAEWVSWWWKQVGLSQCHRHRATVCVVVVAEDDPKHAVWALTAWARTLFTTI